MRLDSFERVMRGGEDGAVVKPGEPKASDMFRRISLPEDDEEKMPSDGKPALSADEIKIIELWIAAGASATQPLSDFPNAPVPPRPKPPVIPLAPDWKPRAKEVAALEAALGVRLAPRSQVETDGLVLRTASAPGRCDDATLARLATVADLIVDAELARTKITNAGLKALSACVNLRTLDLSRTTVTSDGLAALVPLRNLEALNLTGTAVDDGGVARLKAMPSLRRVWLFGTPASSSGAEWTVAAQ